MDNSNNKNQQRYIFSILSKLKASGGDGTTPDFSQARIEFVESLPTASANTLGVIYVIPNQDGESGSIHFTKYDGQSYSWVAAGEKGEAGATPNISIGTVTSGEQASATIGGTPANPILNLVLPQGPQGLQGNTGSSVDYPFELVNNLTTDDATQALSAAQGVVLDGKVSQLEAKVTDNTNDIDALQNQLDNYQPIVIEGDVTNAPDEEDITTDENDLLKFADRAAHTNYLGYVILRKGKSFASQVTVPNTIYEIRYDFDLNGASVQLPEGSCIKFVGGRINNGKLILASNVAVISESSPASANYNLQLLSATNINNVIIRNVRFSGDKTMERAINRTGQEYITNLSIRDCEISGYSNGGINVNAKNALYDGNLIYGCGTNETREHAVDIAAGYVSVEGISKTPNIIITNNRLLSNNVDRHIDVGELYSETNIIISGNTCVAMADDLSAEYPNANNRHGIMVGYAGTSTDTDRYAIISNNIIKYGHWGGIYVRASNNEDNIGVSKYKVNIFGNVISGIITDASNHVTAGIAVEVKSGSIISNNIIENSTNGISLGFMYSDMDCLVSSNSIDVVGYGITIDTQCRKLKISDNQIKAENGIVISPASAAPGDIYDAKLDIQGNNIDALVCIKLYNTKVKMSIISGNTLVGNTLADSYGIWYYPDTGFVNPVVISGNTIRNKNRGIRVLRSGYRMDGILIARNILVDCTTAISAENGNYSMCLPVFDNKFENCSTALGGGVYSGFRNHDGTFSLFGFVTLPHDQNTIWIRGDVVFGNSSTNLFKVAFCCSGTTLDANNAPIANSAKWLVLGLRLTSANREALKSNFYDGTICYDSSMNRAFTLATGYWITDDGFIAERKKGTTAQRPTLVSGWAGYQYYDTDLKKQILWNGTAWVNMDGTALS